MILLLRTQMTEMRSKSSTIDELLIIAVFVLSKQWIFLARTAPIDIVDSELTYGAKFFGKNQNLFFRGRTSNWPQFFDWKDKVWRKKHTNIDEIFIFDLLRKTLRYRAMLSESKIHLRPEHRYSYRGNTVVRYQCLPSWLYCYNPKLSSTISKKNVYFNKTKTLVNSTLLSTSSSFHRFVSIDLSLSLLFHLT